jgi:hypothetical protein
MPLEDAVLSFRDYFAGLPADIDAAKLLRARALAMYWSLGIQTPEELARALVADRSVASREMAMGYLYERVIEAIGNARKLTNAEKKTWRGIDFRIEAGRDVYLINLKSARATSNGDINDATMRNLAAAAKREREDQAERGRRGEDNPLRAQPGLVHAIRAIARGNSSTTTREYAGEKIEILVGDALWERLGAGPGFGRRIQLAIGAVPVDATRLAEELSKAEERVVRELRRKECVTAEGSLDWEAVLEAFPDV